MKATSILTKILLFASITLCIGIKAHGYQSEDIVNEKVDAQDTLKTLSLNTYWNLQETIVNDTLFLMRNKTDEYYHFVFIDTDKSSRFYDEISHFEFDADDDTYNQTYKYSLEYLKKNSITPKRQTIHGLPLKWIVLYQFKNKYYTYRPSDFINHFKVGITDTTYIEYLTEGPYASLMIDFEKIDNQTFRFYLTKPYGQHDRTLTIHIIDRKKGIAVFEENFHNRDKSFYLMIDADKIRHFPIIVNYCKGMKQLEVEFDRLSADFTK